MLMRVVAMDPNDCRLLLWINCICGLWMLLCGGNYWCDMDTGPATISDSQGHEHTIYVSRTRDGSSWLRFGKDQQSIDWTYHDEARSRLQGSLIDPETISLLKSLNYTDYCVLTDLDMKVKSYSAWQPTYLVVYDPVARTTPIIHMKHQKECLSNTTFTMSEDKQGLSCDGGTKHVCGQRSLPEKGQQTATFFLKDINFDPVGDEFWVCKERNGSNVYTFIGSYYHAYVKVASCDIPQNSRLFGHEAKLRPNKDSSENMAVIPDPTQTAMSDGIVIGWQFFIKITSIQHSVYLQIWRPIHQHQHHLYQSYDGVYTLVGQTFVKSEDLRYQDVPLDPVGYIHIRKGDLLGFYHPQQNPLPWSSVPCAYSDQIHRFAVETGSEMKIGQTLTFGRAPRGQLACRHYSFTAVLANSSNSKLIEDWSCPDPQKPYVRNRANVSGTSLVLQTSSSSSAAAAAVNRSPMVSVSENDPAGPTDQTLSFHLALIVAGCLIILLLIVGIVSYCLAMKL